MCCGILLCTKVSNCIIVHHHFICKTISLLSSSWLITWLLIKIWMCGEIIGMIIFTIVIRCQLPLSLPHFPHSLSHPHQVSKLNHYRDRRIHVQSHKGTHPPLRVPTVFPLLSHIVANNLFLCAERHAQIYTTPFPLRCPALLSAALPPRHKHT